MRRLSLAAAIGVGVAAASLGSTAFAQALHEVVPPVVVHHVDAVYPPSALEERKHADVVLTVTIDVDGHVSKVDVIESGGPDLDEAAIVAAREWTFVPAMRDGRAVASRIKMPFHFAPPAPPPELVETKAAPGDVPVHEAVPNAPAPPAPAAQAAPEEVLVTGSARSPSRGPSDFEIPIAELAIVPRANASDFMKLAPGILVTNEGGEGHADSVILRGFDAGEGEAMELSVGGVPINDPGNFHGNGYADTHFILPELIESVRVLEGPFDPHQGNYAVAGSANYELGLAQRGLTAKWTTGSFDTERMLLAWGPEDESRHTFGAAEYAQSDGYGQNRAYKRGAAFAQYEGKLGDRGTWRVTGQAYSVVSQAAGVIREDDYEAGRIGFYGTYDPNQGQDTSRFSMAADLETRSGPTTFSQQLFVIARSLRIREDFTGFMTGEDEENPQTGVVTPAGTEDLRGTMLDLGMTEQSIGARGSARTHVDALGQTQELEVGYFARGDSIDNLQRLIDRGTQVPYAIDADLGGALGDLAVYADTSLKPLSWVTVRGGLRGELFTYAVEDRCAAEANAESTSSSPVTCVESPQPTANPRTNAANSALLPRVSLLLGSFEGFTFTGGYGQGVHSLAIDEVAANPSQALATISSYEGGVSYAHSTPAGELTLRSVFYGTRINEDEVFDPAAGRTVETGATTRTGWVGAGRLTGSFYDESANVAAVRGIVDSTHEGIPYVPHVTARSDTAFFADLPWSIDRHPVRASIGPAVTYVGVRSLPFGQSSDPYLLVDAAAKLRWRAFELGLVATNLFDVKYRLSEFTFVSDFLSPAHPSSTAERSFTAGAPRMLFLSLGATLGG